MRTFICGILPGLSLVLALLGMRNWDARIPGALVLLIALFWAINWLLHHVSLRWLRYLRILLWTAVVVAVIITALLNPNSNMLIVFSILTLIVWAWRVWRARQSRPAHSCPKQKASTQARLTVPPVRIELTPPAPEADALSAELRGQVLLSYHRGRGASKVVCQTSTNYLRS